MRFIELTQKISHKKNKTGPILVNLDLVSSISPIDEDDLSSSSIVYFDGGYYDDYLIVCETLNQIKLKFEFSKLR